MSTTVIQILYLLFPSYLANMLPVVAAKFNFPGGKSISEKQFGKNKTWRWFYVGYIWALLALYLQKYLISTNFWIEYSLLEYWDINMYFYALLFWFWALWWDLIKSYFKRRIWKAPWTSWFPFDQLDLVIWTLILIFPFAPLTRWHIIAALLISPIWHFLTNVIAYWIGWKKVWR